MPTEFKSILRELRTKKGLSQKELADALFVNRTTITNCEMGHRMPDLVMLERLSDYLDVDVSVLLGGNNRDAHTHNVIVVDDEKLILSSSIEVIEETLPSASITGFTTVDDAIRYAKSSNIALAFLDIELGAKSGLDLCRDLLAINNETVVTFLTAYKDYAFEAWDSGAKGFLMKPLIKEDVIALLKRLNISI